MLSHTGPVGIAWMTSGCYIHKNEIFKIKPIATENKMYYTQYCSSIVLPFGSKNS